MAILKKYKVPAQFAIGTSIVFLVALVFFFNKEILGYRVVALLLLMTVSIIAMVFDIIPVLFAATISALIWNFFFIPPLFTFHIDNSEDVLMFIMYFIIALVNTVLTIKIRKEEIKSRDKEEKEQTIKLYNTLVNSLSHELRTPIATILGAVDTLKESKKLSAENQSELLNQIDMASIRLNGQVSNLLNMSRLETGLLKLNLQWTDINELINHAAQKFNETKSHKIIIIPNDSLPICKVDEGILDQILQNLIANAIHYTPANTLIKITTFFEEEKLKIIIGDNGQGVPEELIDKLFNKFYRLPNTKTGGTGLGLSIVKGFVEAHNGTIFCENIVPHGLKFTISLPVETTFINQLKNE